MTGVLGMGDRTPRKWAEALAGTYRVRITGYQATGVMIEHERYFGDDRAGAEALFAEVKEIGSARRYAALSGRAALPVDVVLEVYR